MPRFFINTPPVDEMITIYGEDAMHIGRSLRARIGDEIVFCREGKDYLCKIEAFTKDSVSCRIYSEKPTLSEPSVKLTLYIALPKGDKAETVIQKCIELGAYKIVFFESERCVAKFGDAEKSTSKLTRLKKIALEAAKQSGRGLVPQVAFESTFEKAAERFCSSSLPLLCYENVGGDSHRLPELSEKIASAKDISVMTGSEGGFSMTEAETLTEKGAVKIWLGERILRCETAPIALTAIIMNITGNL